MDKSNTNDNFTIEELQKYYNEFMNKYNIIEEELKLATDNILLEEANNKIKLLRDDYRENVNFLVGYDKQKYLNVYTSIILLLDNLTKTYNDIKDKINPKKKFAFSKKNIIVNKEVEVNNIDNTTTSNITNLITSEYIIKDKKDEQIEVSQPDRDNLILENLENCEVTIPYNFKALYAQNLTNCIFYLGSISGGSHLTSCVGCKFYLITHQLRIHKTTDTIFNIISASSPIIEDCSKLIFTPLKLDYINLEDNLKLANIDKTKNKWNSVLDFKWHKKEKSPNFELKE